jgi:hypothetical protein
VDKPSAESLGPSRTEPRTPGPPSLCCAPDYTPASGKVKEGVAGESHLVLRSAPSVSPRNPLISPIEVKVLAVDSRPKTATRTYVGTQRAPRSPLSR